MKSKISKWLSILIPLILGIGLITYQYHNFSDQQIIEIKGYFKNADYIYIYLSLIIALFGFWSRAYRWKFSLEQLGYQTKFHNNLMAVCIAYLMNLTIPRSGEISRALVLKKYEEVPFDKAFGTIVAERVVDFLIFLLFVVSAFIIEFDILKEYVTKHIPIEKLSILFGIAVVGFISFVIIWFYSNWKIVNLLKDKFSGLIEGMTSILKMKHKWAFLFHSFFIWFTYLLMFYITIFALKETSSISIGAVIVGFIFGSLAIGFTNSGFGVYPFIIAEILFLYAVPQTAGTAFGWLIWTSQTILTVALGGLSFLLLPILNRK
ncbi:lysylphosphatidylglycerol synthase transmembrane domain-containing protein [Flavobacterium sp. SUN046]|uniref:lysylphosphatidylglycerol synthase transmembrane domain-containing protein n=1 Tax=Flavobacterium sp. SUN046 TaxID=3002440 RepID=UPI002DB6D113|nr:lysylphosphatidylglycerol synthase transmembrane domain-containing protein [Flavobacterium sp. SUN046]MEC4050275.1 lysylphosphatidylglycerol synthase transmembrane domain-containing protein [Flavobacterium sp. SUN046]